MQNWGMKYQNNSPFTILETKTWSFNELQKFERFAKAWDAIWNSGHFSHTVELWKKTLLQYETYIYDEVSFFAELSFAKRKQSHSVALVSWVEDLWEYLKMRFPESEDQWRTCLITDYTQGTVSRDIPSFLRKEGADLSGKSVQKKERSATPDRQRRHL
jgi:hypothetical protein